jgi:hypothetical protein
MTVPALSTVATVLSVLFHTVAAPSSALPRASVAVTASCIVSPIALAVSTVGEIPIHRTLVSAPPASESASNFDFSEWVYERIDTNPAPAEITPAPQRQALLISPWGRRA